MCVTAERAWKSCKNWQQQKIFFDFFFSKSNVLEDVMEKLYSWRNIGGKNSSQNGRSLKLTQINREFETMQQHNGVIKCHVPHDSSSTSVGFFLLVGEAFFATSIFFSLLQIHQQVLHTVTCSRVHANFIRDDNNNNRTALWTPIKLSHLETASQIVKWTLKNGYSTRVCQVVPLVNLYYLHGKVSL